ncbi:ImmA/IrrE family metallo-endopeptidase [Halobacillus shinanisalinarum]|uniref:ImmA/IrrE family metallo-endopeptidase n=1 Tax=Halobacillus shinanisalinarum TaxID=2932258 RepID=A0ABY4H4Z8_9BACI|nr:ImmA/IrrE family metallo-endopeptidase [Halobacillus shinanisalinarum]UOQ95548.1 ImmA/IrrE family metallo-endopeptidase [Halobacillus shinanisalinarum]
MYHYTPLESYMREFLLFLSIQTPNQLTIDHIMERLNIHVHYWNDKSEAMIYKGKKRMFINKQLSNEERWQIFGHELCHIMMHHGSQFNMPASFLAYQEWKADNFALHVCVPTFMLLQMDLPFRKPQAIYEVASTFGVTPQFASRRLEHLENQYIGSIFDQKLIREMSGISKVNEDYGDYT